MTDNSNERVTDARLENIARAICKAKGYDPDAPIDETRMQWQSFTELAKSTAMQSAATPKTEGLDICPDCNGAGVGVADTTCGKCNGSGGVPKTEGLNTSILGVEQPRRIWLMCYRHAGDVCWSNDPNPDDADEIETVEYVRADTIKALTARLEEAREALIDIRNRILCPVGPTPTLDEIEAIASATLSQQEQANANTRG